VVIAHHRPFPHSRDEFKSPKSIYPLTRQLTETAFDECVHFLVYFYTARGVRHNKERTVIDTLFVPIVQYVDPFVISKINKFKPISLVETSEVFAFPTYQGSSLKQAR